MVGGLRSELGVPAQNLVGLELNQGQGSAPTRRQGTVVATVRALALRSRHATPRNVQVNFNCACITCMTCIMPRRVPIAFLHFILHDLSKHSLLRTFKNESVEVPLNHCLAL